MAFSRRIYWSIIWEDLLKRGWIRGWYNDRTFEVRFLVGLKTLNSLSGIDTKNNERERGELEKERRDIWINWPQANVKLHSLHEKSHYVKYFYKRENFEEKKRIFWRKTYFKVTSSSRVSITGFFCWKIKYLVFFRRLMRLNLRELVLKYKGRPIEWGLGERGPKLSGPCGCPSFKDQYATKSKKKEKYYEKMIPLIFIWTVLNLRSLKGDCVLGRGR